MTPRPHNSQRLPILLPTLPSSLSPFPLQTLCALSPRPSLLPDVNQMQPSRFADREEKLAAEGRGKYKGTARVPLEVLHFPWAQPREPNQKSVDTLKRCFEKGQCDRVTRNHVPAVIDQSDLDEVLRSSNASAKRLLNNEGSPHPKLTFPAGYQLCCLHGRQRIQAAREVLPPRERWWTVDLYLAGMCNRGSEDNRY